MSGMDRRRTIIALVAALALALPASAGAAPDIARYILPPGAHGGLPTDEHSRDQIPLYDDLTPLRGNVDPADINRHFLRENFKPVGNATREQTGRTGLTILRDAFGIPHIRAKTRAAAMFGSGWVTAKDRGLLLALGRNPARLAVIDAPGVNAFGVLLSGRSYQPSAQAEALVTRQRRLLVRRHGKEGRQILQDAANYAAGINAYWEETGNPSQPYTVNDVIAVTAFIGSIFGAGGGAEVRNSDLLARLRASLGGRRGTRAWNDFMSSEDPEAFTTVRRRFNYGRRTGGRVTGSLVVDPSSVQSAPPPAARRASNFLLTSPGRSKSGDSLAVMGPQLGYFYPELVYQMSMRAPGIRTQGAFVPGAGLYTLIGRTPNYAWSLTSAGHDVRDEFLERLCNPEGSPATRDSVHYMHRGRCRPMGVFDAGTLDGQPLRFRTTVHGPVQGTATVDGRPHAIAEKRSTRAREGLNLAALKGMAEGDAARPADFFRIANRFEFTFNWAYASRRATAFFSSGRLPERARGLDRMLPTLGTGNYEWRGFLSERQHPHDVGGPRGLFLNWNNKSAPGFMHGDDEHYSSRHRVDMFDDWPRRVDLVDVVAVMNRAASEDFGATEVWPVIRAVLGKSVAPDPQTAQAVGLLDAYSNSGGSRLDRDLDGTIDHPGAAIFDESWPRIADAVFAPVLGAQLDDVRAVIGRGGSPAGSNGSHYGGGWWGYVSKDLRTLLGRRVKGRYNVRYCGRGSLAACRASIWAALQAAVADLSATQGPDPNAWRADATAERISFSPGLIPDTMRWTNRPTFQQVLRFNHP